jgi:serine/threonine protein phosphatase PrpC
MRQREKPIDRQVTDELSLTATFRSKLPLPSPPSALVKVDLAGLSHQGHVRPANEDHYFAARIERSLTTLVTNLAEGILPGRFEEIAYGMVVADGIGGMAAGEVASSSAVCKLIELVVNTPDWIMILSQSEDAMIVTQRMTQRFRQIDDDLREQARRDPALVGMGTTMTAAVSLGADLVIGSIGDSRAYLLRGTQLHQLTRDHTMAQAIVDAGIAKPHDAVTKAMRHVLTAALGSQGEKSDPDVHRLHLRPADQLLLCTDGLTEMVEDQVIASTLRDAASADEACSGLIDLALAGGGKDNVTVVLARYQFPPMA